MNPDFQYIYSLLKWFWVKAFQYTIIQMIASRFRQEMIRRHKVLTGFNLFMYFALIAIAINIADSLYGPYKDYEAVYILSSSAVILVISLILFKNGYTFFAKIISGLTFNIVFLLISFHIGQKGGTYLYYFPFILAYIYLFRTESNRLFVWVFFIASLAFLLVCVIAAPEDPPTFKIPASKMREIFLLTFFISFLLTVYFFVVIYSYQQKLYNRVLELEKNNRIQQLRSVIESHEMSNQRLMIELRDNINQTLAVSKMFLEKSMETPNNKKLISKSRELTNEAMNAMTLLCIRLHPAVIIDVGLAAGIKEFIAELRKISNVQVRFDSRGSGIEEIDDKDKISIFRIIQDYLVLLIKNASASQANIVLTFEAPLLTLTFSQNDPQFDFINEGEKFKFTEINNRITYYKGTVRRKQEGQFETSVVEFSLS